MCVTCGEGVHPHDAQLRPEGAVCCLCLNDSARAAGSVVCLDCATSVPAAEAIGEPRGPLCPACAVPVVAVARP